MQHNKIVRGRPSRRSVYRRLEEAIAELRDRLGGLPSPIEAEDIWTTIWYQEAHHSTALEGNTLVLRQVELLLAEGRAVGNKELREYMEVRGYADAARWVYGQALEPGYWTPGAPLTLTELRHVHGLALGPVWGVAPHPDATPREKPGSFREHEIQPFPGGMTPPSWVEVPAEVTDWIGSLASIASSDNVIERIAAAHGELERIHPFLDGNGRAGRLVMNLLLVRVGFPPAIIYTRDRSRYLRAVAAGRRRRARPARRDDRPGRARQPVPLRRARGGWAAAARPTGRTGRQPSQCLDAESCRRTGAPSGPAGPGWSMAEQQGVDRGIPGQQVQAGQMTSRHCLTGGPNRTSTRETVRFVIP